MPYIHPVDNWKKWERSFEHLNKYLGFVHDDLAEHDLLLQEILTSIWKSTLKVKRGENPTENMMYIGKKLVYLHEYIWHHYNGWARTHRRRNNYFKKLGWDLIEASK